MEILPLLQLHEGRLLVTGSIDRLSAHGAMPLFHATAIVLAVTPSGKLLLADQYEKKRKKAELYGAQPPQRRKCLDCFGGHLRFSDITDNEKSEGLSQETFEACALRELSEELLMRRGNGWVASEPQRDRLKGLGFYILENDHNREYSHAFVYSLDCEGPFSSVELLDTSAGEIAVEQAVHLFDSEEFIALFESDPHMFSDGVGRILEAASKDGYTAMKRAITRNSPYA